MNTKKTSHYVVYYCKDKQDNTFDLDKLTGLACIGELYKSKKTAEEHMLKCINLSDDQNWKVAKVECEIILEIDNN